MARDLTHAQFVAAMKRHGFKNPGPLGYWEYRNTGRSVSVLNAGNRRRSQLAYMIRAAEAIDAEMRGDHTEATRLRQANANRCPRPHSREESPMPKPKTFLDRFTPPFRCGVEPYPADITDANGLWVCSCDHSTGSVSDASRRRAADLCAFLNEATGAQKKTVT